MLRSTILRPSIGLRTVKTLAPLRHRLPSIVTQCSVNASWCRRRYYHQSQSNSSPSDLPNTTPLMTEINRFHVASPNLTADLTWAKIAMYRNLYLDFVLASLNAGHATSFSRHMNGFMDHVLRMADIPKNPFAPPSGDKPKQDEGSSGDKVSWRKDLLLATLARSAFGA